MSDTPATPPAPQRPALSAASQEAVGKLHADLLTWGNDQLGCEVLVPEERERLDLALAPLVARLAALEGQLAQVKRIADDYAAAPCITALLGDEGDDPCTCFVCAHRQIAALLAPPAGGTA